MSIAKRILVATDFSELGQTAVERGLALALAMDSKLEVVHVLSLLGGPNCPAHLREEVDAAEGRARAGLDMLAQMLRPRGDRGEALLLFGEPAAMILVAAEKLGAELIVLGSHGRGSHGRTELGSTARRVALQSRVPVLVVKRANEPARTANVKQLVEQE